MPENRDIPSYQLPRLETPASRSSQESSGSPPTVPLAGLLLAPSRPLHPLLRAQRQAAHDSQDRSQSQSPSAFTRPQFPSRAQPQEVGPPFATLLQPRTTLHIARIREHLARQRGPGSSSPIRQSTSVASHSRPVVANWAPFQRGRRGSSSSRDQSPSPVLAFARTARPPSERGRRLSPSIQPSLRQNQPAIDRSQERLTTFPPILVNPSPAEHPVRARPSRQLCPRSRSSAVSSSSSRPESASPRTEGPPSLSSLEGAAAQSRGRPTNSELLRESSLSGFLQQGAALWEGRAEEDAVSPSHSSADLDDSDDEEVVEPGWDAIQHYELIFAPEPRSSRPGSSSPENSPPRREGSPSSELEFDDENFVQVDADDPELDWDNQPFDYTVPFTHPILQETYQFEREYPRSAPILRRLYTMSVQVRRASIATSQHATTTWRMVADGLERMACTGRIVYNGGRFGVNDLALLVDERWEGWGPLLCTALEGTLRRYDRH